LATGRRVADRIASEAATSLAAAAGTGTLSAGVPGVPADTTARVLVPAARAVARAWALGVEAEALVGVAGGAGKWRRLRRNKSSEHSLCHQWVIELLLGLAR